MTPESMILPVPTLEREAFGWPKYGNNAGRADYHPLAAVLSGRFPDDRHCAAYSLPSIPYRLAGEHALAQTGGVPMVLAIFDIDDKLAKHEKRAPTDDWRAAERAKVERLFARYPGGFFFTTRGGYRIFYRLPEPIVLSSALDARRWSARYEGWSDRLADDFAMQVDRQCCDWPRLFRLPYVERDGVAQMPEIIGDPAAVGVWPVEIDVSHVGEYLAPPRPLLAAPSVDASDRELAIHVLVAHWPAPGHRHEASHALCGALLQKGWSIEDTADLVTEVSRRAGAALDGDYRKRYGQAQGAFLKLEAGETLTGWGNKGLKKFIAADVVDAVQARLCPSEPSPMAKVAEMAAAQRKEAAQIAEYVAMINRVVTGQAVPAPARPEPMSGVQLRAHFTATRKMLSRRADPNDVADAALIGRALARKENLLRQEDNECFDALAAVAAALVRHAPEGCEDQRLAHMLGFFVRPEAADAAIAQARATVQPRSTSSVPKSDEGFEVVTSGPRIGKPSTKSQANVARALELFGVALRWDLLADREVMSMDGGPPQILDDKLLDAWCLAVDRKFGFLVEDQFFKKVCTDLALRNPFHPVRDYLDGLHWDGVQRLGGGDTPSWLTTYGGAPDTPYVRAVGRLVLVAAVRRVRDPGCKFDELMILEGDQGGGKSSALRILAVNDAWFGDDLPLTGDTKRQMEATASKWFVEAGELHGMRRGEVTELKSYLSRGVDECRLAYGRLPTRRSRQFVIIGTTNEFGDYLRDQSGNRRFWPVRVQAFDLTRLREERDQIWAEAAAAEAAGEDIRLAPELYPIAAQEQQARQEADEIRGALDDVGLGEVTGRIRSTEILRFLNHEAGHVPPAVNSRINAAMQALGYEKTKLRIGGLSVRCWVRGATAAEQTHEIQIRAGRASNAAAMAAAAAS